MWSNDIICKYMFLFPLKNLARKGLIVSSVQRVFVDGVWPTGPWCCDLASL